MSIKSLKPSIAFNRTCARAIALYEVALGARVEQLVHYSDGAKMGQPFEEATKDLVLNAELSIGGFQLMVMDTTPARKVPDDSNVAVYLEFDNPSELEKSFEGLSKGGDVTMPLSNTFWGSRFGMVRDAFGIRWMLSHQLPKK